MFPRLLQRLLLVLNFVAAATLHSVSDLDPAYQNCGDDGRRESDSHGDEQRRTQFEIEVDILESLEHHRQGQDRHDDEDQQRGESLGRL